MLPRSRSSTSFRDEERGDVLLPGYGWATPKHHQLLTVSELPEWYVPLSVFVRSGYRAPGLSACACAATLVQAHNETGNCWTHLLGGLVWVFVSLRALGSPDLAVRADGFTYALHAVSYGLCGLMPLLSTLAHLFHCRSALWYDVCWHADHVGILALWLARALCESYVLLYCHRGWWLLWAGLSVAVFAASAHHVVATNSTRLFLPLYAYIHLPLALAALLDPAFLAVHAAGPGDALRGAAKLTLMGSLCGVAGYAVMVSKVPERWSRHGVFDTWGHSHQWWHVLTIAGPVLCLEAGRDLLAARLEHACPA